MRTEEKVNQITADEASDLALLSKREADSEMISETLNFINNNIITKSNNGNFSMRVIIPLSGFKLVLEDIERRGFQTTATLKNSNAVEIKISWKMKTKSKG